MDERNVSLKPNFIIIGAARCATTSLHKYLGQHPDIFLSEPKEINYFSNMRFFGRGQKWYNSHFEKSNHQAVGEGSTSYTSSPNIANVAERIHAALGEELRLIYIVRDPIKRMLSHHTHYISRGDSIPSLDRICEEKKHSIIHQGRYSYQLSKYLEYYEKSQISVITVEQLQKSPHSTMKKIYSFLNVESNFEISNATTLHNNNNRVIKKSERGQRLINWYHRNFEHLPQPYMFRSLINRIAEIGGREYQTPLLSEEQKRDLQRFYYDDLKAFNNDWGIHLTCGGEDILK